MLPRLSISDTDKSNHGLRYLLFETDDTVSNFIRYDGEWEPHLVTIAASFCNVPEIESPLVLDIGANLGAFSIPIAKHLSQRQGSVYAYEPLRITYYQLCSNIILNGLDNCYAHNMAISDIDGKIEVDEIDYFHSNNVGGFTLLPEFRTGKSHIKYKNHTVQIPSITLNSFQLDTDPTVIKIDTEGYEERILNSAGEFLERYHYPAIIFEGWTETRDSIFKTLQKYGYLIYNILIEGDNFVAQHPKGISNFDFVYNSSDNYVHMRRVK